MRYELADKLIAQYYWGREPKCLTNEVGKERIGIDTNPLFSWKTALLLRRLTPFSDSALRFVAYLLFGFKGV